MTLQAAMRHIEVPAAGERVRRAVDDLDDTIRDIRSTIYALQTPERGSDGGLRTQLLGIAAEAADSLGFAPSLRFEGLVEQLPQDIGAELAAVVREALSNCARHAKATTVSVTLAVSDNLLTLSVVDDGIGIEPGGRSSGLSNLAERAAALGGRFQAAQAEAGGTEVSWIVPLAQ